jgi:hypothetical protein
MNVDNLIRLELPGQCEHARNISTLGGGDTRGRHVGGGSIRASRAGMASCDAECRAEERKNEQTQ